MNYQIEIKDIPETLVATIRFKGTNEDNTKYGFKLYKACRTKINGPALSLYYDKEFKEEDADIECCMPIKKEVLLEGIQCKTLPSIKAICTKHFGGYETISNAYEELINYVIENGIQIDFPTRLIFLKIGGKFIKGNTDKYVTEIVFPIKE